MGWLTAVVWLGMVATFYWISNYLERSCAMRGTKRIPLPSWTETGLRLFFLFILVAPLNLLIPLPVLIPMIVLYIPFFVDGSEKRGDRIYPPLGYNWVFYKIKAYFSLEVKTVTGRPFEARSPNKTFIFAMHPHGFLPVATLVNILSAVSNAQEIVFGKLTIRTLAASFCFYIPGYRDLLLAAGVVDAARYNARRVLDNGMSLVLFPGGATEGLYASPGNHTLVLRCRQGFIRLALETGSDIVPVYSFGEVECYRQLSSAWPIVKKFQAKFQKVLGLSLPLVTNLWPRKNKITTVFGKPIPVERCEHPTDVEIEHLLEVYIQKLTELFDEQAPLYIPNPSERKLHII